MGDRPTPVNTTIRECLQALGRLEAMQRLGTPFNQLSDVQMPPPAARNMMGTHLLRNMQQLLYSSMQSSSHCEMPLQGQLPQQTLYTRGNGIFRPKPLRPVETPRKLEMILATVIRDGAKLRQQHAGFPLPRSGVFQLIAHNSNGMPNSDGSNLSAGDWAVDAFPGFTGRNEPRKKTARRSVHQPGMPGMPFMNLNDHVAASTGTAMVSDVAMSDDDDEGQGSGMDARLEIARKKNREAQQRFRDKRRQQHAIQEQEYHRLCRVCDDLGVENDKELLLNDNLTKILAVRGVILSAMTQARGDIRGNQSLAVMQEDSNRHKQGCTENGSDSQEMLARCMEDDIEKLAQKLSDPEDVYIYYRQWQIGIKHLLREYTQTKDIALRDKIEALTACFSQLWMRVSRIHQNESLQAISKLTGQDDENRDLWNDIANQLAQKLSIDNLKEICILWHQFSERVDKFAGQRLEATMKLENMAEGLSGITSSKTFDGRKMAFQVEDYLIEVSLIKYTTDKIWESISDLSAALHTTVGAFDIAVCHMMAHPQMPNWLCITREIVRHAIEKKGISLEQVKELCSAKYITSQEEDCNT